MLIIYDEVWDFLLLLLFTFPVSVCEENNFTLLFYTSNLHLGVRVVIRPIPSKRNKKNLGTSHVPTLCLYQPQSCRDQRQLWIWYKIMSWVVAKSWIPYKRIGVWITSMIQKRERETYVFRAFG